jgi:hypothetical protein
VDGDRADTSEIVTVRRSDTVDWQVLFGIVSLNSVIVTVLPVVGLLTRGVLAGWGNHRASRHPS